LRDYFAPDLLQAAAQRSRLIGVGADRVLIHWGVLDEASYLQHLSAHTGVQIEAISDTLRSDIPLPSAQFSRVVQHGLLPLLRDGEYLLGIAPRILTARWLSRFALKSPDVIKRLRLLPSAQLNQALIFHAHASLAHTASEGLNRRFPGLTAAPSVPRHRPRRFRRHASFVAAAASLLMLQPFACLHVISSLLAVWFLAFSGTRIVGAMVPLPAVVPLPQPHDDELPTYTIIAALYREAASVRQLLRAITALHYPKEKLDVILVVEPDDHETHTAIVRWGPLPSFQVLVAPATLPRTKPKALNWALPFVRGSFVTIYDAEDIPEPNQLRAALDAFRANGPRTVCVQASLCINNSTDSWLSCMFAAEYAGQFDVFLPGLATLGLPLPLGGSSNHFRTAALREVGGWDAYNVTEDADLGFRLARAGYRATIFTSTTFEEAPAHFGSWLRQRSRWMKGWMQTWDVHMRTPRRLWREAGIKGILSLNLLIGGNVLTALAAPILLLELVAFLGLSVSTNQPSALFTGPLIGLHIAAIVAGYASTIIVGLMGLTRRGRLRSSWVLTLTPIYWALLSIAAWRALYQLFRDPYRWEKTEHGLTARQTAPRRRYGKRLEGSSDTRLRTPPRDRRLIDNV
jgi:cellulose synthase/poly-beta-1,6-N-acetylglucosamine synthase-like glycosyltransferase